MKRSRVVAKKESDDGDQQGPRPTGHAPMDLGPLNGTSPSWHPGEAPVLPPALQASTSDTGGVPAGTTNRPRQKSFRCKARRPRSHHCHRLRPRWSSRSWHHGPCASGARPSVASSPPCLFLSLRCRSTHARAASLSVVFFGKGLRSSCSTREEG